MNNQFFFRVFIFFCEKKLKKNNILRLNNILIKMFTPAPEGSHYVYHATGFITIDGKQIEIVLR